jgi:hypothetical protein
MSIYPIKGEARLPAPTRKKQTLTRNVEFLMLFMKLRCNNTDLLLQCRFAPRFSAAGKTDSEANVVSIGGTRSYRLQSLAGFILDAQRFNAWLFAVKPSPAVAIYHGPLSLSVIRPVFWGRL